MISKKEKLQIIYRENYSSWESFVSEYTKHLCDRLSTEEFKFNCKARIKSLESLNAKIIKISESNESIKIRDLIGLRITVPFLEDVDRVVDIIREAYDVLDVERKSEALSYREFAYDSVHLEISLADYPIILPEICARSLEVQIRTTLQDAWAEVEHELVYKSNVEFPDNQSIRKKLAALNANLSLSDMIFQEIRDKQRELETWGQKRFQELQKNARKVSINSITHYLGETDNESPGGEETVEQGANPSKNDIEKALLGALEAHNQENYRRAIDLYTEALKGDPSLKIRAVIYNHRGLAFFMMNKEQQALKDFENSFNCDPTYYCAINNRALVLRRMGLTFEALYNFSKSLELDDSQAEVYYLRAQTNFETGNFPVAVEDLKKAIELNPGFTSARDLLNQASAKLNETNDRE